MSSKIHVTNLSFTAKEDELRQLFSKFGAVTDVSIPTEVGSQRPRGFAFVEFTEDDAAEKAEKDMQEYEFQGHQLCIHIVEKKGKRRRGRW